MTSGTLTPGAPIPAAPVTAARPTGARLARQLTRNRAGRYVAAVCGVVAVLLFPQPWVRASLHGIGEVTLSGLQLARHEAATRVDAVQFGPASRPATSAGTPGTAGTAGAGSSAGAGSGGLTLPTRVPTVAAGSGGLTLPTRVPTVAAGTVPGSVPAQNPAGSAAGGAGAAGGLTLPTRVPTVAPGQAAQPAPHQPAPATASSGTEPAAPVTLPQFSLYFLLAAAAGLAIFPLVWERQVTERDRRFGTLWTLVVSYGGALWSGSILYTVLTAPPGNALVGPGVGGTTGAEPALWLLCIAFVLGALSLTGAWLSTAPRGGDARRPAA
jgi:hypothetical protein